MVRLQNIGVQSERTALLNIFKQSPKATVVLGVSKNRLALIAPADDVVKSPGEENGRAASYAVPLASQSDNIK